MSSSIPASNVCAVYNSLQRLYRSGAGTGGAFLDAFFTGGKTPGVDHRLTQGGKQQLSVKPGIHACAFLCWQVVIPKQRFQPFLGGFKDTNIFGDSNSAFLNGKTLHNVGLKGNYTSGYNIYNLYGVLDIEGNTAGLINYGNNGYLRFGGNVGVNNIGYKGFQVVDVIDVANNIEKIGAGNSNGYNGNIILFGTKTQAANISQNSFAIPTYRAFKANGSNTKKFAPISGLTDSKWQSATNPSGMLPDLNIDSGETLGHGTGTTSPTATAQVWTTVELNGSSVACYPAAPDSLEFAAYALFCLPTPLARARGIVCKPQTPRKGRGDSAES